MDNSLLYAIKTKDRILRVAHRGFHPENKLEGFRQAVENGCDMIECDLRLSADNHPVIIHDKTINRTTNGNGYVSKLKLRDLQFYGIPSLEELIIWLQQHPSLYCAFEIKDIGPNSIVLLSKTLSLIKQYNILSRSIVISFNHKIVSTSKVLCPNVCTGLVLYETLLRNPFDIAQKVQADVLWVNYMFLSKCISCNTINMPVFVWTVNTRKHLQGLDASVVGVVSDDLKTLYNQ
jgi:glycerophosphoryl diester phosphodiesterase